MENRSSLRTQEMAGAFAPERSDHCSVARRFLAGVGAGSPKGNRHAVVATVSYVVWKEKKS